MINRQHGAQLNPCIDPLCLTPKWRLPPLRQGIIVFCFTGLKGIIVFCFTCLYSIDFVEYTGDRSPYTLSPTIPGLHQALKRFGLPTHMLEVVAAIYANMQL